MAKVNLNELYKFSNGMAVLIYKNTALGDDYRETLLKKYPEITDSIKARKHDVGALCRLIKKDKRFLHESWVKDLITFHHDIKRNRERIQKAIQDSKEYLPHGNTEVILEEWVLNNIPRMREEGLTWEEMFDKAKKAKIVGKFDVRVDGFKIYCHRVFDRHGITLKKKDNIRYLKTPI